MASYSRKLIKHYLQRADKAKTTPGKGKAFEDLALYLFENIPGLSHPKRNKKNQYHTEENVYLSTPTGSHLDSTLAAPLSRMRYSFERVRRITLFRAMAGVAMHISSRLFLPSNSNFGPALMTNVSPSSLKQKILPSYAHGEAV